jgi:EAL domain-containing protein (putative c-di-GMP-specific phosphodiesterase class I)
VSRTASEHTIARLGGDEFTILLEGIESVGDAIKVADRIHDALAQPFNLDGHELFIAASIGITLGEPGYQRPEDLLRDADTALYSAKAGGKSRYEVFDSAMRTQVVARLQLESDLRRALERDELRLHYQPIMSLENERLIGFEALLRWQHPQRGLLPPDDFIAMAEENGLIIPIGWWVLDEALRQFGEWHGRFPDIRPLMICVNLSPKQFFQASLVDRVERRLSDTGVDPRSLKLEVTEHAIMSDPESAAATLTRLRSLGVQIGIDDFGTGYSSLNYLRRFPIDTLKIDRSFVHRMSSDVKDLEIVQTILTLAHNLAMDVVAEGVETIHQRDQLQTLGCELGQGFYFSRAIEGPAAEMLLARCLPRPEESRVRNGPASETGPPIDPTCSGCTAPHDP